PRPSRHLLSFPTRRSSDLFARGFGEIHTSRHAGGITSASRRVTVSASRIRRPFASTYRNGLRVPSRRQPPLRGMQRVPATRPTRSEEHTSELQSRFDLVCR